MSIKNGIFGEYWEKYKAKLVISTITIVVSILAYIILGYDFMWMEYTWLPGPIWVRVIFSALTFTTIGAFLYYCKFWKAVYELFKVFGIISFYNRSKAIIWLILMWFIFWLTGLIVDILNHIFSILINIISFIYHSFPYILILLISFYCWRKYGNS